MIIIRSIVAAFALTAIFVSTALADEWLVDKARGVIEIQKDGAWQAAKRGDLIADGTLIRTGPLSQARLVRGAEWVDLSSMTMIEIHDRDGRRFTTVLQMAGTVEVEAEVQNVQHFSVETPYLAAVVKGTHFVVSVGRGRASVDVSRGLVAVDAHHGSTYLVPKGSAITVEKSGAIAATGNVATKSSNAMTTKSSGTGSDVTAVTVGSDGTVVPSISNSVVDTSTSNNPCNGNSGNSHGQGQGNSACRTGSGG